MLQKSGGNKWPKDKWVMKTCLKNMIVDSLERILHPSGHGAFFTERIQQEEKEDIIVVYDCGTTDKNEKELLEKEINEFFSNGDTIDILFISHFDSDHVNGIGLLKPYITNKTKMVMPFSYEYFYLPKSAPTLQFMSMVMGIISDVPVIECWVRYAEILGPEKSDSSSPILDETDMKGGFLESGLRIGCGLDRSPQRRYKWIYVPFNLYDDRDIRERYENEVKDKINKDPQDIKATDLDEKVIENLRKIYKNLGPYKTKVVKDSTRKANESRNINFNSLIVLSKATHYNCECDCKFLFRYLSCKNLRYCDGSCLYTGDSNLKKAENVTMLMETLDYYTEMPVCLFQIPHHGSGYNYGKKLLRSYDLFTNCFVNCGARDFNKKSFSTLISDVKNSGRNLIMVSGKKYCRLEQVVEF